MSDSGNGDANEILLIADEVQSGFGRTGKMFAIEAHNIEPDIICMAKGIASGFPFAALGMRRSIDATWRVGSQGGSSNGNPIGCAAALATIEVLTEPGFLDNVHARGNHFVVDSVPPLGGPNEERNPLDLMFGSLATCGLFVFEAGAAESGGISSSVLTHPAPFTE